MSFPQMMNRAAFIALLVFAPSAFGGDSRPALNVDKLLKVYYCIGVERARKNSMEAILADDYSHPSTTLPGYTDLRQALRNGIAKADGKLKRLNVYASAFLDVPLEVTPLTVAAAQAGLEDDGACAKSMAECPTGDVAKTVECIDKISTCSKVRACSAFNPFAD